MRYEKVEIQTARDQILKELRDRTNRVAEESGLPQDMASFVAMAEMIQKELEQGAVLVF